MKEEYVLYRTSDIYFGAYLISLGLRFISTELDMEIEKKKMIFVFEVPKLSIHKLKSDYFSDRAVVKAMSYAQALKSLKSACYT